MKMHVRFKFVVVLLALYSFTPLVAKAEKLPNILLFVTDDQRYDDLYGIMNHTEKEIFNKGITYDNAFVTTPACCPSRSSIFTGLYTSGHAVRGNKYVLNKQTFIQTLKDKYFTGLIGKYLNSWDGSPRPEFNYWVSFPFGFTNYVNPILQINSKREKVRGYITKILEEKALDFLDLWKKTDKPFLLILTYNAPHFPYRPYKIDKGTLSMKDIKLFPNFNEKDRSDKPNFIREKKALSKEDKKVLLTQRIAQRESLLSVDRSIKAIIDKLKILNGINDTLIMFISDNGISFGEHAITRKDSPYDESVKVPFALRYKNIKPKRTSKIVANIDIAPTIYDITKTKPPYQMHGRSLFELEKNESNWRKGLMIEGFMDKKDKKPFAAYRTEDFYFIKNKVSKDGPNFLEFYDLKKDPFLLVNQIKSKAYKSISSKLEEKLNKSLLKYRGTLSFDLPKGISIQNRKK